MNGEEKLIIMRKLMIERGFDVYIFPHGDQHNNEYIAEADERIKFISNFSGSNGIGLVTQTEALMWTDGRYFIQIEAELYPGWEMKRINIDESITDYIQNHIPKNAIIAMDFHLFSDAKANDIFSTLTDYEIKDDIYNIIDDIWGTKKPKYRNDKLLLLSQEYSGASVLEKYQLLTERLKEEINKNYEDNDYENDVFRLLISKLDDIAWLLNLRGKDIPYNPVFFSYAFFYFSANDSFVHLFIDKKKCSSPEIIKHCKENKIDLFDYNEIYNELENNNREDNIITIMDNKSTNFRMANQIIGNFQGQFLILDVDCIEEIKSVKNPVEIEGFRNANIKDSVALIKFFAWMEDELLNKKRNDLNEYEIGLKSKKFRQEQDLFMGESFAPICGSGPNAAIIHYEQNENLHSDMSVDKIILCDTGAQYMDGTTDITRTVHYGNPTPKEKEMFTRVLLGNLSLERLTFRKGSTLANLDCVTRSFLNMVGKDYMHSTSHGVGHFLNVHEGPKGRDLKPGNIITNEPGYYEKDNFGIRIENEVLVVEKEDGKLGFENLTLIPYERNLIDMNLISNDFKKYIDNYHKLVFDTISPLLDDDAKALEYLKRKTQPL